MPTCTLTVATILYTTQVATFTVLQCQWCLTNRPLSIQQSCAINDKSLKLHKTQSVNKVLIKIFYKWIISNLVRRWTKMMPKSGTFCYEEEEEDR